VLLKTLGKDSETYSQSQKIFPSQNFEILINTCCENFKKVKDTGIIEGILQYYFFQSLKNTKEKDCYC
jgi:hypothetical protein